MLAVGIGGRRQAEIGQLIVIAEVNEQVAEHFKVVFSARPQRVQPVQGLEFIVDIEHLSYFLLLQMLFRLEVEVGCHVLKVHDVQGLIFEDVFGFVDVLEHGHDLVLAEDHFVQREVIVNESRAMVDFQNVQKL